MSIYIYIQLQKIIENYTNLTIFYNSYIEKILNF